MTDGPVGWIVGGLIACILLLVFIATISNPSVTLSTGQTLSSQQHQIGTSVIEGLLLISSISVLGLVAWFFGG